MSESNEEILSRFLGYWATREPDAMVALCAEDCVYDNVPERKPMQGRDAIRQWLGFCFDHLTRIDVEVLHSATKGEWTLSERLDTHVIGEKHMPLPVMNCSRIVNGEIVEFRDYYDRLTVKELGMLD